MGDYGLTAMTCGAQAFPCTMFPRIWRSDFSHFLVPRVTKISHIRMEQPKFVVYGKEWWDDEGLVLFPELALLSTGYGITSQYPEESLETGHTLPERCISPAALDGHSHQFVQKIARPLYPVRAAYSRTTLRQKGHMKLCRIQPRIAFKALRS